MTRAEILAEASRIITQDRNSTYGEPEDLFEAICAAWDALDKARGERPRTPSDVALYMAAFKLVRASANPRHLDSVTDAAGYSAIAGELATPPHPTPGVYEPATRLRRGYERTPL